MSINLKGKFSFPYPSFSEEEYSYYYLLEKSSQEYKDEISDIYFSDPFQSKDGKCFYGDIMSAVPDKAHHEYLLKINNELNVPISLTFNSLVIDKKLTSVYLDEFVNHIKWWYDRGVRSCTISNTHMMSTGRLHYEFPKMKWKNTVNHMVDNAQEVLDYYKIGYDIILLDRSLNRNWPELENIKKLQLKYPKLKTSLLVTEACAPNCLFKKEHDDMQADTSHDYWSNHANLSCNVWRQGDYVDLPRMGTDLTVVGKESLKTLLGLTDILKFSGRMGGILKIIDRLEYKHPYKFGWAYHNKVKLNNKWSRPVLFNDENGEKETVQFESFSQILNSKHELTLEYMLPAQIVSDNVPYADDNKEFVDSSIWILNPKAKGVALKLRKCKNQCWDCNACEKLFGLDPFDSYIDINRKSVRELDFPINTITLFNNGQ